MMSVAVVSAAVDPKSEHSGTTDASSEAEAMFDVGTVPDWALRPLFIFYGGKWRFNQAAERPVILP